MSWWNDFPAHRGGMNGSLRRPFTQSVPTLALAPITPVHARCTSSNACCGMGYTGSIPSDEATWGTTTTLSDATSLWQTNTSTRLSESYAIADPPAASRSAEDVPSGGGVAPPSQERGGKLWTEASGLHRADVADSDSLHTAEELLAAISDGDLEDFTDLADVGTISSLLASLQMQGGAVADATSSMFYSSDEKRQGVTTPMTRPDSLATLSADAADQQLHSQDPTQSWRAPAGRGERLDSGASHPPVHVPATQSEPSTEKGATATTTIGAAPVHLTPSILEGLLASFQTALHTSAEASTDATPVMPASPDNAYASGVAPSGLRLSSPGRRSRGNPIVAHKLSIDGAISRRVPSQEQRRCLALSMDSTGSDHAFPAEGHSDQVLMQSTGMPTTGFTLVRQMASGASAEEVPTAAHHTRTVSDLSMPSSTMPVTSGPTLRPHYTEQDKITVVDPQRRKLHMPLSAIEPTKALNGRLKMPSLCLLYQSGRCRQGDNCYQVHVDPSVVERLRVAVESLPCCCLQHGDCNSHLANLASYEGRCIAVAGQLMVPLTRVAYTAGLQRFLADPSPCVTVNASVLCRLHGRPGGCRFGPDCKFLHVCCEILRCELAVIMADSATAASTPNTSSQQLQQPSLSNGPETPCTLVHSRTGSATTMPLSGNGAMELGLQAAPMSLHTAASGSTHLRTNSLVTNFSAEGAAPMPWHSGLMGGPMLATTAGTTTTPTMSMNGEGFNRAGMATPQSPVPYFTVTTVQRSHGQSLPIQSGRPGSQQPQPVMHQQQQQALMPGTPPFAPRHGTLSGQSSGANNMYVTPGCSGDASPLSLALPGTNGIPNMAGAPGLFAMPNLRPGGVSSPRQQQLPQRQTPSSLPPQQFFVPQMNMDGTVSLMPVNVLPQLWT